MFKFDTISRMVEQLFGSKTRVKLLQLFYSNPNRSYYVREITRKIDEQINSVRRELANLLNIGIISSETTNNKLYYEVSKNFDYYTQLSEIFGTKAAPTGSTAKDEDNTELSRLKPLGRIDLMVLTGKFTRDEKSGIDLLLVGDINNAQLEKYVEELEKKEGKNIRYVVMPPKEFIYRRKIKDRFLSTLTESKKQVVVDKENLLEEAIDG